MKKINDKYFTIGVYVLIVAAVSTLFGIAFLHLPDIFGFLINTAVKLSAIFYGILFAMILLPLVRWLEGVFHSLFCKKKERPRLQIVFAVLLAYLFALILLLITFGSIIPVLIRQLTLFADNFNSLIKSLYIYVDSHFKDIELIRSTLITLLDKLTADIRAAASSVPSLASVLFGFVSDVASEISSIFMGAIISVYFLVCRRLISGLCGKVVVALFPAKSAVHLVVFFKRLYSDFCAFAGARILASFCFTAAVFVLSWVMNIPMFSIIVLILLFSHLFPVVGPLVGDTIAVVLVLLLRTDMVFFFIAILIALEILASKLLLPALTPKKLRPSYGLTAALVLFGFSLLGFIGAFLALPVYTTLNVEFHIFLTRRLDKKNMPVSTEAYCDTTLEVLGRKELEEQAKQEAEKADDVEKEDGGDAERGHAEQAETAHPGEKTGE